MNINIQSITNILSKYNIKIPETFLKEELIRIYAEVSTERLVEIPLILQNVVEEKQKILDVGCRYSLVPIQLASLGHQVYGIDITNYKRKHPNFHFFKADILKPPFKANFFDIIISLSTIEHIGFTRYGDDRNEFGDIDTVKQIYGLLKKNGIFLLTAPFGKAIDTNWYRVYDMKRIQNLLTDFLVLEKKVFIERNNCWIPSTTQAAELVDSSDKARAMIFIKAKKK